MSLESQRVFQNLFCFAIYITNHLMTGPLGNSEFCSRDEVERNLEIRGKQK